MIRIDVDQWNREFSRYPVTVNDKGWVYGVWYCGTSFQKVALYGQYPPGFVKRALALFAGLDDERILHCPSGTLTGPGVTVDAVVDNVRCPQVQADAGSLPFDADRFDLVLSDPPYSAADSEKYGCKPFPMGAFMREARRVLIPGGFLGVLHTHYPSYRRKDWKLVGLIGVITGFQRATRVFAIFQNLKPAIAAQSEQMELTA